MAESDNAQDPINEVTVEQAQEDISRFLDQFETVGQGTEKDRAAYLAIETLAILRGRVTMSPSALKFIYIGRPGDAPILPDMVLTKVKGLISGTESPEDAGIFIDDLIPKYVEAFSRMNLNPQLPKGLFLKKGNSS